MKSVASYKALSYVWGDPQVTEKIMINGNVFFATTNLAAALKQFRHHHYRGFIWADAICINQSDLIERSEQVLLMYSIYSLAAEVVAWLGPEVSDSRKAMVYLNKFDDLSEKQSRRYANQSTLDAILNLLSRPWWFIVWIAQEMILPHFLTVWCGPDSVSFGNLERMLIWAFQREDMRNSLPLTNGGVLQALMLGKDRQTWQSGGPKRSLTALLHIHRARMATDVRDKIYAIYSLCRNGEQYRGLGTRPNYSRQWQEVYAEVAVQIMIGEKNLDILSFADSETNKGELPSWAPNWKYAMRSEPIMPHTWTNHQLYSAAGTTKANCTPLGLSMLNLHAISLQGILVNELSTVCEAFVPSVAFLEGDFEEYEKSLLAMISSWHDSLRPGSSGKLSETDAMDFADSFWRTLITDVVYVLLGAYVPFLLRKEAREAIKYRLIGECYVQGVMDGQMINKVKEQRVKKVDLTII